MARKPPRGRSAGGAKNDGRATVSGAARVAPARRGDLPAEKLVATEKLAAQMPFNPDKPREFGGPEPAPGPPPGVCHLPGDSIAGASTVREIEDTGKTGSSATPGRNHAIQPLTRVRVDDTGRMLTTNQGVAVADNQNSLKAGLRGPTLLEDFVLREKITHFDHERIPERIVHARGSAAHGVFECTRALGDLTRASVFAEAGKRTPVFVRFSTVIGERGSTDTARDVRGFATRFYTDEGNWDLVGNNIPIFFIQDAMKFPDLVHAAKPEPHHAVPQASTAHDTFWDFASLMPEITAMLLWTMSDRAIPRSYRTMQGFGVNTYRLVNAAGVSHFVKFHWSPKAGTHSLVWDEAVRISGADPDFHRRDLWEAIESGAFPDYQLGLQVISEAEAERYSFDVLDATKIVPEELVPVMPVGRMVLNRNPDNFFAETEQVAFCVAHVVPGIDFSNDPLLAGRIHSYVDTQISRLGGPNFHEIPINTPLAPVHNNQRDGMHRQAIARGRVAYEPNSLAGGCPFQGGRLGFQSAAAMVAADAHKVRGKPERFADHYTQARLFWNSQTATEKRHIIAAFRFELSRVQVPAVRERMVAGLLNVSRELAAPVAQALGITTLPEPLPKVMADDVAPEVERSPALSLFSRPGNAGVAGLKVAVLGADGFDYDGLSSLVNSLREGGAVVRLLAPTLGPVRIADGRPVESDSSLEATPSVLFDAVIVADGQTSSATLRANALARAFVREQYRHCKPLLAIGAGRELLAAAEIPEHLANGAADPGLLAFDSVNPRVSSSFLTALSRYRHFERESDPPLV